MQKANITVDLQGHEEDIRKVTAALAALLAYPLNALFWTHFHSAVIRI